MAKYLTAPVARKAGAHNHAVRRASGSRACSPRASLRSSVRSYRRCSSTSSAKQLAIGREDPRPSRVVVSDSDSEDDEEDYFVMYSDYDSECE